MIEQEIEALLDAGFRVGFEIPTDDDQFLGWILVSKVKANVRMLEVLTESDAPELIREEHRRQVQPYMVLKIELKRSVHEAGGYETEADYRRKDRYWFATLDEVAKHLVDWGYSLEQAKEAREIDAP